jgi:predicted RNA-binding Zn ribbon-like protein
MTDADVLDWLHRAEPALSDFQEAYELVTGEPVIDADAPDQEATWDEIMAIGDVLEEGALRFDRWLLANPPPPGAQELARHVKEIADAILRARAKQQHLTSESQDDDVALQRLQALRNELGLEVQEHVAEASRIAGQLLAQ